MQTASCTVVWHSALAPHRTTRHAFTQLPVWHTSGVRHSLSDRHSGSPTTKDNSVQFKGFGMVQLGFAQEIEICHMQFDR